MSDELSHLKTHLYALLISDLINFCNFIFSDPLYVSYFLFFSPYLLKLVSFLSPLFLTTFLLFFAFLTGIVHEKIPSVSVLSEKSFRDDGLQGTDELGIYEILFGTRLLTEENENRAEEEKVEENPGSGSAEKGSSFSEKKGVFEAIMIEQKNPSPVSRMKNSCPGLEERRLENFLKILDQFEKMSTANAEQKKKIVPKSPKAASEGVDDHVTAKITVDKEQTPPVLKPDSQRLLRSDLSNNNHSGQVENEHIQKVDSFRTWSHSSSGSLNKEKEWRRTLACKLFEERHNVDGGEGMDSLWEVYEMDSNKSKSIGEKKKKSKKTSQILVDDDDDDDDEVVDGRLCCLQAVRLSSGKMNLGIGRPNLVKISKAIKGFGWLHHVSKHSKKVHSNGDR